MSDKIIIGIAGGTGSGKTTVMNRITEEFGKYKVSIVEQDAYYKNLKHLSFEQRVDQNFDHPDAIDFDLMIKHVKNLKNGKSINKPMYNFKKHLRESKTELVESKQIIIVEGILIFAIPELMEMFDLKIFVDTDDDERLLRRIERDMVERGRSFESIKHQYLETVKPMHLEFVMPSRRYADIIIPRGGENRVAINLIIAKLQHLLN